MKFHGLMLVRDEEDILPQTLSHLLTWIDGLYVLDLGSIDSTWNILQDFAEKDERVVLHASSPIVYQEGLRSLLFNSYRQRFQNGDWIVKTDADEFYDIPPPDFVRNHLRIGETCVYLLWYFFRLTSREVAAYETGQIDIVEERKRLVEERRRSYKIPDYAEPRMFRYRQSMQWSNNAVFPVNMGYVARERIPIRHYPHRDPWQMAKRYRLRAAMKSLNVTAAPHWTLDDWHQDVIDIEETTGAAYEKNRRGGLADSPGHTAGPLRYWDYGETLPKVHTKSHLARPLKRIAQRLIHPCCLPLLDRCRPRFSNELQPQRIPDNITAQLRQAAAHDQH